MPRGILRIFVGCVTRPEYIEHRAHITLPRNTPKPKHRAATTLWLNHPIGHSNDRQLPPLSPSGHSIPCWDPIFLEIPN